MEKIKRLLAALIICVVTALVVSPAVFAGEGGGGGGGGDWISCSGTAFLSTACGAEWRYYSWGESADGVHYSGNDVKIDQFYYGGEAAAYAYGGTIKGCKEYGGYWRYAMVAYGSYYGYSKGSQVGLIGINGGGDIDFASEVYGGGMNNYNPSSWKRAKKVYESYQKMDPDTFWRGFNSGSNLSWFCGGYDPIEEKTLTGVAIDNKGNNMSGMDNVTDKVQKGSKASVTRRDVPTGWTYRGWGDKKDGKVTKTNITYTVSKLNDDTTVYSVYEKNTFSGRASSVNAEETRQSSTGWTNTNKTADSIYICNIEGCKAKIFFDIKRTGGSGETKYTIYDEKGNPLSGYNGASTSGGKFYKEFEFGLDAGQKRCYSMKVRSSEADNAWFTVKACVAAPYNFTTSTELNVKDDEIIYSGEEKNINYTVTVNEKDNDAVGRKYCTPVPRPIHGIQIQYNNGAWDDAVKVEEQGQFGCGDTSQSKTITVKDVPAGTPICIRTFITPASSGVNTNLNTNAFDFSRVISGSTKCFAAAKRPTMQVLGGSYYSGKKTETSTAFKHIGDAVKVFGSWGEQSVIGVGTINGFASGSANSSNLASTEFCLHRTLLTFNNIPCSGSTTQNGIGVATANDNRDALVDYWVAASARQESELTINIGNDAGTYETVTTIAGKPVNYTNTTARLTVNGGVISTGLSRIIKTSNDVDINGNISYADGIYGNVSEIPKLIISANNITISCGVERIDAILIAKNSVNTCDSYGSTGQANESVRGEKLTVRGMIIANKLIPSRTHGAGTKEESGTPAEIINYDSSAMLWAQYMAGSADTGALTVTYQRELAPRY